MSIESGEVHDWPPVTSAHASRGQPDATRSLAVRPVASIQSAKLTARRPSEISFRGSSSFVVHTLTADSQNDEDSLANPCPNNPPPNPSPHNRGTTCERRLLSCTP